MFDLNDLASTADEGAVYQVVHPIKGEIDGMTITLLGTDSDLYRTAFRELLEDRKRRAAKRGKFTSESAADMERTEAESTELFVKVTKAWTGFVLNGEDLRCTPENVRKIYNDPKFAWLKSGVLDFVGDRENFFDR